MKLFNRLALVAVSAAMVFGFASCAQSDENPFNPALSPAEDPVKSWIIQELTKNPSGNPDKPGKPSGSGSLKEPKSLEFHVDVNSTDADHTMIFVKYDRSAYGAEEEVKVTDAELNLYINGAKVKTYNKIDFALDEYGAEISSRGPISDPKAMKEYKAKLAVGKEVKSGDVVKIELVKASVVKVGAASDKITLANLQFALIDTDASVDYYKELAPNAEQFLNICTLEDLTTGDDNSSSEDEPDPNAPVYVKVITLEKNTYAEAPETQVKIDTGFDSLAEGDEVVLKMKGTSDKAFKGELVIIDSTEAGNWWMELTEKLDKDFAAGDFDVEHKFVITAAPLGTGAKSMVFAINGKDHDDTTKLSCTEFSLTKVGAEPSGPEGSPDSEGFAEETIIHDVPTEISWGDFVIVPGSNFTGTEAKTITIYYDCTTTGDENYTTFKIAANYNGAPLGDGVVTGGALNPGDKGAINNTGDKGETGKVVTYVPTAEEWASMSTGTNGLYINGYNIKINKITLK